jgi:hypothetical protein
LPVGLNLQESRWDFLHAAKLGHIILLPLWRKDFSDARKIQRLRPGLNPRTRVPVASMLTTRPPKPSFNPSDLQCSSSSWYSSTYVLLEDGSLRLKYIISEILIHTINIISCIRRYLLLSAKKITLLVFVYYSYFLHNSIHIFQKHNKKFECYLKIICSPIRWLEIWNTKRFVV